MPEKSTDMTISLDGKTICSTIKMEKIESPLHIISAQVCELGLTLAQRCTDDKSNEIPAVQELLKELNIKGHIVVADALNCQKETAEIIVNQKADYLLCLKDNHPNLKKDIEDFVQDISLQNTMHSVFKIEQGHGRIEKRTAYITSDIDWLQQCKEWKNLKCIGAIHTEFTTKKAHQANGIIIFQAVHLQHKNYFIMLEWSGLLKLCIGFLTFILKKIGVELKIRLHSKA